MKLMACAVMAMSMLAGAAQASEWRLMGVYGDMAVLVDTGTIENVPNSNKKIASQAWLLRKTSDVGVDYMISREEFDCDAMITSDVSFIAANRSGAVLATAGRSDEVHTIDPNGASGAVFRAVCNGSRASIFEGIREALDIFRRGRRN